LAILKSNATRASLLKQLSDNFPNFLKKDLDLIVFLFFNEIKNALRRGDACELRGFCRFSTNTQKESIRRNPRTGEKVHIKKKQTIKFKMSKELFKKINNE